MNDTRGILCVIDLGESTPAVLNYAASIAACKKSPLLILFSYRLINTGRTSDVMDMKRVMEQDAITRFAAFEECCLFGKDIKYEFHPEIGFTGDRIHSYVKRGIVSMVVIGEQQAHTSDEGRTLTLEQFISKKNIPVFIVPCEMNSETVKVQPESASVIGR